MSTIVAAYHYYRPFPRARLRDSFLLAYYTYQKSLEALTDRYRHFLRAEVSQRKVAYLERDARANDGQEASPAAKEVGLLNYTGGGADGGEDDKNSDEQDNKPQKGLISKIQNGRKKAMAVVAVGGATVTFVGAFLAAPGFIMNQISSMLMDKTNELQTSQATTFRRSKYSKFTDVFSFDGRRGGAVINEMKRYGYDIEFDDVEKTKIAKIAKPGVGDIDAADFDKEISEFLDKRYSLFGIPTRSGRWKTKRMEAFYSRFKVTRSSPIVKAPGDLDDPEAEFNKRSFNAIDGNDELETRVGAGGTEPKEEDFNTKEEYEAAKKKFDDIDSSGSSDSAFAGDKEELSTKGTNVEDLPGPTSGTETLDDGLVLPEVVRPQNAPSLAAQGFAAIKGIGLVTDVFDKMCSTNKSLEAATKTARLLASVKLMRATFAFVAAEDGQRKGEAASDMMKELIKRVAVSDKVLGGFGNSQGYKATINKNFDKSANRRTRSAFSTDGKLTGFWGAVKENTKIPDPGCPIVQNAGFQIAQFAGTVTLTVFTGGSGAAAGSTAAATARAFLTKAISKILTKEVAFGIATGYVIDYTFDELLQLAQVYVQKKLDIPFTGQETGGRFSAMLFSGAGVMHKQRNLKSGFVPATKEQFAAAQNDYLANVAVERKQKSFAERIFNVNDTDSLASKGFTQIAFQAINPVQAVDSGMSNIASLPSLFASALTAPLAQMSETAYAAPEDSFDTLEINGEEYATDPYGNLQTIMPNWLLAYSDPAVEDENTEYLIESGDIDPDTLEPISEGFKGHVENCVESTDTISILEEDNADDVKMDCLASQSLTKRFKGHLINLDADDYIDAALFPEEISEETTTAEDASSPVTNTGASAQYIPDCSANNGNAKIACVAIDTILGIPYRNSFSTTPGCRGATSASNDPNPSQLDCSSFTSMAVYRAFGTNAPRTSVNYLTSPLFEVVGDTRREVIVGDIRSIRPGDIIGKGTVASGSGGTGHVGIVVSYDPLTKKLITVETDRCSEPSRVVTNKSLKIDGDGGSYEWAARYVGTR